MTETTFHTDTIAAAVADLFGGDGMILPEDYEEIQRRHGGVETRAADAVRVEFPDGSAIVHLPGGWDAGFTAEECRDPMIREWVAGQADPPPSGGPEFAWPEALQGGDPRCRISMAKAAIADLDFAIFGERQARQLTHDAAESHAAAAARLDTAMPHEVADMAEQASAAARALDACRCSVIERRRRSEKALRVLKGIFDM